MATRSPTATKPRLGFKTRPRFILDPEGRTPLAGFVEFSTHEPVIAEISVSDGDRDWSVPAAAEAGTDHRHLVLALRPGRSHRLAIRARAPSGALIAEENSLTVTTAPLPADFPDIEVAVADGAKMEPGVTFFGIRKSARMGAKDYGYLVAVDETGTVVWYYRAGHTIGDIKRLRNGNLIYLSFDNRAVELDMSGRRVNHWYAAKRWPDAHKDSGAIPVDVEAFHHEIFELANGNFLVLAIETRDFDDYPSSETDAAAPPRPASVAGDVVVEFQRDGTVVREWKLLDILDPHRIGYGSLGDYWAKKGLEGVMDWSHANAVVFDAADNSLVVSVRHQDAVVKIDYESGQLKWILGTHDGWRAPWRDYLLTPVGDLEWPYHQHNARPSPAGGILMFDNGNYRARPFSPKLAAAKNYSRAVEFAVDEGDMTVSQTWSHGGPGGGYAAFICGAGRLARSGNVLINFGGLLSNDAGEPGEDPAADFGWVRMVEVTRRGDGGGDIVFELIIDERQAQKGWDVYRAERLESLYG